MSKPKGMLKRNEFMRLGFAAFILVASAHVYQLVVELSSLRRAAELAILTSPFFAWLQISFIVAFVITAISA